MLVYAIGDLHLDPNISNKRLKWMGRDVQATKPDLVVQIGDLNNMNSLCKYEANDSYLGKIKTVYIEDVANMNKALETFNDAGAFDTPKYVTLGNHDDRIESYANRNPEVYAFFQEYFYETLSANGWTYSTFGEVVKFEGVNFTHVPFTTLGKPMGGTTVEYRAGNLSTSDFVFGHSHRAN